MKYNTKIRYGLRTMVELAMTGNDTGVLQKDIAKNQEISVKYLDYIIASLKKAGLIKNVKGKKSGYRLTRSPADITVNQIFQVFDKELTNINCLLDNKMCKRYYICATRLFWKDLNNTILDFLQNITLKDLAFRQKELNKNRSKPLIYHI